MGLGKTILIGSAIAVPILAVGYYNYVLKSYDYSLSGFDIIDLNGANSTVQITLTVTSKIGIALTMNDVYFDIYVEGNKVGNVYSNVPVTIPNVGSQSIVLTATVDLTLLESNATNIIYGALKGKNVNVTLVGYTHVQVGVMPFATNVAVKYGYNLSV